MLIITHNNHIICDVALLFLVVETVIYRRNIVIDRQHQPFLSAGNRQLADKLDVMDARRRLQTLKIQIDTVKSITVRLCHHIFNQFFAHRRPGKKHLRLHVLAAFAAEIVEYRPDLKTFFMRPIHIGLICQRFIRAAVAAKRKPRRRDDIDTFRLCNQRIHRLVCRRDRYLMPDHHNLLIQ